MNEEKANNIIEEFKSKLKKNPNDFIIIKKYNYKIFKKYKQNLYKAIEYLILCEVKAGLFKRSIIHNYVR